LLGSTAAAGAIALANCRRSPFGARPSPYTPTADPADSDAPLHLYTWADYADDEVFDRFTQSTGIAVVVQTYDSNETMLAKIQAGGGQQFSILYPSDYMVQQMIALGLLATIDHTQLRGLEDLLPPWQSPTYDPNNAHSVPLSWGTTA
jgi:spermidine/putrescine transport system substrate-binding protein